MEKLPTPSEDLSGELQSITFPNTAQSREILINAGYSFCNGSENDELVLDIEECRSHYFYLSTYRLNCVDGYGSTYPNDYVIPLEHLEAILTIATISNFNYDTLKAVCEQLNIRTQNEYYNC